MASTPTEATVLASAGRGSEGVLMETGCRPACGPMRTQRAAVVWCETPGPGEKFRELLGALAGQAGFW